MQGRVAEVALEIRRHRRGDRPHATRYPVELRKAVASLARRSRQAGERPSAFARRLGVPPTQIARWVAGSQEIVPVGWRPVVVDEAETKASARSVVVSHPSGVRVEGLTLSEVASLLRQLS